MHIRDARAAGETVSGERMADTMDAAVAALRREQILVTRITPAKAKAEAAAKAKAGKLGKKVTGEEPGRLHAPVLGDDRRRPAARAVPRHPRQPGRGQELRRRHPADARPTSKAGASLADAMRKHPKTFDPLFTNMIAAGEAGGILDTILKRLATYIEKAVKLTGQVKSAMIYPIAVIVIAGARRRRHSVEGHPDVRVAVRRPRRRAAAADAHRHRAQRQPGPLLPVLSSSALGAGGYALPQLLRDRQRPPRRRRRRLLKLPILGDILRKIAVARFCRTLSTLISSGVPILDGLEITAKTAGNAIIEDAIMATRKSIERGETIAAPLKETAVFPPMVTQMIGVGEATGALDTMLAKIADFYEEEVDTAVAGLLTLLEPIMIAFLGVVVGGIVIAMYLPIFDLISKLT